MYNKLKELILTANLIDEILSENAEPTDQRRVLLGSITNLDLNKFSVDDLYLIGQMIELLKLQYMHLGQGMTNKVFNSLYKATQPFMFRLGDWNLVRDLVGRLGKIYEGLRNFSANELKDQVDHLRKERNIFAYRSSLVFIGHGRNKIWRRLESFIQKELKIDVLDFESETRTSESIINVLDSFLDRATFAILVFTGEDPTADGSIRARQNVIHEAGLFQGRLGFDKVVLLKQDITENLSNLAGLQYISFTGDNIEETYLELKRVFRKHGLLK